MSSRTEKKRPFKLSEIPTDILVEYSKILNDYVDAERNGNKKLANDLLDKYVEIIQNQRHLYEKNYESNPPNLNCKYAVIFGILVENATYEYDYSLKNEIYCSSTRVGNGFSKTLTNLFEFAFEKVYIWTYNKSYRTSMILVNVDVSVKQEKWWKTLSFCLYLAFSLYFSFKNIPETGYNWIYYFDKKLKPEKQKFLDEDHLAVGTFNGIIVNPDYFASISPILELLLRDERFFSATRNLVSSFENHKFDLIHTFETEKKSNHSNSEPSIWENVALISKMESSILQATRSCEGILGAPGGNKERVKERWIKELNILPNSPFVNANKPYIEYYSDYMFKIRAGSAHINSRNLANFPYELSREITIQAQIFAYEIVKDYYEKNRLTHKEALISLKFNQELLSPVFKQKWQFE